MAKRPIDAHRDAAVFMDVGDETDQSPLKEMVAVSDRMLIVKEQSIWQMQLADEIDPDRANIKIPNTQQKLLGRGTSEPIVCRTLLQAKRLLKKGFLPDSCDPDSGMVATLNFLREIDALLGKIEDYRASIERLNETFEGSSSKGQGLTVPAIGDVSSRGKGIVQTADHGVRYIWQLVRAFDTNLPAGVDWSKLQSKLEGGTDDAKRVAKSVEILASSFSFLRNTRNAIEHPKPGQEVIFHDYRLRADGKVTPPTITIIDKKTPLSETDLNEYFSWLLRFLVDSFEAVLVNLATLNVTRFGAFDVGVTKLDKSQRRYGHVAYAYATWMGDQLVPFGD